MKDRSGKHFQPLMKLLHFSFIILSVTAVACNEKKASLDDLEILCGTWVYESNGREFIEFWERNDRDAFSGSGLMVKDNDTSITELLSLVAEGGNIYYIPKVFGQNENKPVKFRLTSAEDNRFVFENPEHDFPQMITYSFSDSLNMNVAVEKAADDPKKKILFSFTRE